VFVEIEEVVYDEAKVFVWVDYFNVLVAYMEGVVLNWC